MKLADALNSTIKGDLKTRIGTMMDEKLERTGEMLSGRSVLRMVVEHFRPNRRQNASDATGDVLFLECSSGADGLAQYLVRFDELMQKCKIPIDERIFTPIFEKQLRNARGMSQDLRDFDRMDDDDLDRSYLWLRRCADKQVERERERKQRKDYLTYLAKNDTKPKALAAKGGSKGEAGAEAPVSVGQCFDFARDGKCSRGDACRFLHGTTVPSGAKGKGKGKAKGKKEKGKGKGKEKAKDGANETDKRNEMECYMWKKPGGCTRGDSCPYAHAEVPAKPAAPAQTTGEARAAVAMSVEEGPFRSMVTRDPERVWLLDSAWIGRASSRLGQGVRTREGDRWPRRQGQKARHCERRGDGGPGHRHERPRARQCQARAVRAEGLPGCAIDGPLGHR